MAECSVIRLPPSLPWPSFLAHVFRASHGVLLYLPPFFCIPSHSPRCFDCDWAMIRTRIFFFSRSLSMAVEDRVRGLDTEQFELLSWICNLHNVWILYKHDFWMCCGNWVKVRYSVDIMPCTPHRPQGTVSSKCCRENGWSVLYGNWPDQNGSGPNFKFRSMFRVSSADDEVDLQSQRELRGIGALRSVFGH